MASQPERIFTNICGHALPFHLFGMLESIQYILVSALEQQQKTLHTHTRVKKLIILLTRPFFFHHTADLSSFFSFN